jgi:uncharacterized protein (DUF1015 family)
MATVLPFNGIRYNPEKVPDGATVTTPPYDVISPDEQASFYARHPNNVIRLILGHPNAGDSDKDNPHTRSAAFFRRWLDEDVLRQDAAPSLYLKAITYPFGSETITRFGLIARVKLEPFEKRIILPHEKTFSKVRSERLALMKATHCNYCPIFSLYPDDGNILKGLETSVDKSAPCADFIDEKRHRHQLWQITDPAVHARVTASMQDKRLFIADGHHRYETALNFKQYLADTDPSFDDRHPANYVMMYLCSMSDPGLIILPAHRLLKSVSGADISAALAMAGDYFEITTYFFDANHRSAVEKEFLDALAEGSDRHTIGIYARSAPVFRLLTLKPGVMDDLFGEELDPALRQLDVSVLTRLLFMKILGFDQARLDDASLIGYASQADQAIAAIDTGAFDVAFILNATKIEQVQEVAQQGLIMPRKSTYFFPKVRSGLVMCQLVADDSTPQA